MLVSDHVHRPAHSEHVRLAAVSGTSQRARAFAATTGPGYETLFARPLIVRIVGRTAGTVRFSCEQRACRFAVSDQPDEVKRVDPRSYDVTLKNGRAELTVTLSTDSVPGNFTVVARPVVRKHVEVGSSVRFGLSVE